MSAADTTELQTVSPAIEPRRFSISRLGSDRGAFIVETVPEAVGSVLDIGCSYGWTLGSLSGKAAELWGVDMDAPALERARRDYPHIRFIHQTAAELPFESAKFDVAILSEVIEHVGEENKQSVIDEAHRVLKPGGLFVFTAPYAGLFAWADPMDVKRRATWLYRLYTRLTGYAPSTPCEIGHKHLSMGEIERLFAGKFRIEEVRYCGLLMPWLTWLLVLGARLRLMPRRVENGLNRFRAWESGVHYGRVLSFNVRLTARKIEQSDPWSA